MHALHACSNQHICAGRARRTRLIALGRHSKRSTPNGRPSGTRAAVCSLSLNDLISPFCVGRTRRTDCGQAAFFCTRPCLTRTKLTRSPQGQSSVNLINGNVNHSGNASESGAAAGRCRRTRRCPSPLWLRVKGRLRAGAKMQCGLGVCVVVHVACISLPLIYILMQVVLPPFFPCFAAYKERCSERTPPVGVSATQ